MSAWNRKRTAMAALISYPTIAVGDAIPQTIGGDHFEEASEFGEPQSIATDPDALIVGYTFKDYDLTTRATWKFLRNATAERVYDLVNRAMESANRLITGTLLRRLFDPAPVLNEVGQTAYGLYTGTDGIVPPSFAEQDFPSSTSHYLVSGTTALDPGDLADAINQVTSKVFGIDGASRLIVLCNPKEAEIISTFRAGAVTNSVESKYDFIPSNSSIPYLTNETVVGQIAPAEWSGLEVSGSYGPAWVVPSYLLPQGYSRSSQPAV